MLSLHTRWDPTVPLFHEELYAAKVAANGDMGLLEQRVIDRYGHCNFSVDEVIQAVLDLVAATTPAVTSAR